jgi:major membrane immunogen (membrane-anchored lipoprotein)
MKKLNPVYIILILFSALLLNACSSQKSKLENQQKIAQLLENNHFKFVAQQANPLRTNIISSQLRNLDGRYDLKISQDSIKCYLPYFGQARQADYGSSDNGIQFVSTDFNYSKIKMNNGNYQITIIPNGETKTSKLLLEVSANGYATLNVTSTYRDQISFNGIIEKY